MVRVGVVALFTTGAFAFRHASENDGHIGIQIHDVKELEANAEFSAAATAAPLTVCQTAWNQRELPAECPYVAEESCPETCQTYFTGVLDSCSVGDYYNDYGHYSLYTLWEEFHSRYPTCNLGLVPPACQRAWNEGSLPLDCPRVEFNRTTYMSIPSESCPEPCQTYFSAVLDICSVGDAYLSDGGTGLSMPNYAQYALWGQFYSQYPTCNLGYTATACTAAMAALDSTTVCERSANAPCTADCAALFEAVKTNCAAGPATYVPISAEGSRINTEQTWSQRTAFMYRSMVYDETCVALLNDATTPGASSEPPSTPGAGSVPSPQSAVFVAMLVARWL